MAVVAAVLDPESPMLLQPINIIGGGGEEWSTVELRVDCKTKQGTQYQQNYAWVVRWKPLSEEPEGKIVQVRAYLDTALLDKVVHEYETFKGSVR